MSMESELQQERDERIAELEKRIQRRGVGVKAPVAVLALVVGGVLLGLLWKDLAYFFSPRTPLTLGTEGEYRYDVLESNRYVQLHGVPTLRGAYGREGEDVYVVVGLRESPFLVRRRALPGEEWTPGGVPPRPDPRPFGVRGRLLAEEDAERYREGFKLLREMREVQPKDGRLWLVVEGERPGGDKGVVLVALLLVTFMLGNAALLYRGLKRKPT
ncbi:hypothetical protein [Archangium lansingense]|uniref:SURF1-like protein n=1 Tax=Archangium lansingense TaxID=2995310 RepID=A0ABT4A5A0_9BACT|nr:hypothetical protein [Archangium lansinium]MCY1076551.1 hypothetical protein [Archangium lansinium]